MNPSTFDPKRLDELLLLSAGKTLTENERSELNSMLREHPEARSFASRSLMVDSLLSEGLIANEIRHKHKINPTITARKPSYLARAAAWIGAFLIVGKQAQAATTGSVTITQTTIVLLMKKTATSVTFAIVVLGTAGTYAIHHQNKSIKERVTGMESEIATLSDQLGIHTHLPMGRGLGSEDKKKSINALQLQAIFADNKITREENAVYEAFQQQLLTMDVESLKNLLLDAEKISNPIEGHLASAVLKQLIMLDPAEATRISTLLISRCNSFHFSLATSAAEAFGEWLEKDPIAADAWYREIRSNGILTPKSIPPHGLEEHALDRSFERLRFKSMVQSNPTEAEAMLATMLPGDVTMALREVTDPDALRKILPKVQPEQKIEAAKGVIEAMAANDPNAAHQWARSLGMTDRESDTLMAGGIKEAVASGKLDLNAVSEWTKKLDLDATTRADTQVDAVLSASRMPGGDSRAIDWNRVTERIDWLRKEAAPESADRMVGEYLGKLAYNSQSPDQSFKAYEAEIARRNNADPALTIAYARYIGMIGPDRYSEQALQYLHALPPSKDRDNVIHMIQINR